MIDFTRPLMELRELNMTRPTGETNDQRFNILRAIGLECRPFLTPEELKVYDDLKSRCMSELSKSARKMRSYSVAALDDFESFLRYFIHNKLVSRAPTGRDHAIR